MQRERALVRMELVVLVGTVSLLFSFAALGLGHSRSASHLAACRNNLRQIGAAAQVWGSEHEQRMPWWTPVNEGGTSWQPGNAWFHWAAFTNELKTPRLLVCPSDDSTRVAAQFDEGPNGFFNGSNRGNALSYIVGLHSLFEFPDSLLSADPNLPPIPKNSGCSTGMTASRMLARQAAWTNGVHGFFGNVLLLDGRVETLNTAALSNKIASERYRDFTHFLSPR